MMAVVTIDAKGELEHLQADIDAADAFELGSATKTETQTPEKAATESAETSAAKADDPDDVEGDDGLTPRQKREFTQAMQKAIGKKHRMQKEAEEFAAAQYNERRLAEQRAIALDAELTALKAKGQPPEQPAPETAKPERAKFATDQEFLDAMIAWGVEDAMKKRAQEEAKRAEQQHIDEMLAIARQKSALVPDFADALQQATALDIRIPPLIYDYMLQTEMGAELSYYLAKNPEIVKSLWKMQPSQQLVTIGKIESTLQPFVAKTTKAEDGATPSKAATNGQQPKAAPSEDTTGIAPSRARDTAPVIRPLNGTGSAVEPDPANMNIRETIVQYQKSHGVNLGLRKRH